MDKSKSEKLKEILNQTLSPKDIEEKLKKEIENNQQKKKEEKEENLKAEKIQKAVEELEIKTEENILKDDENKIKVEPIKESTDKSTKVPNIEKKSKEQKNLNILLYLIIIIAILLLAIAIYLFTNNTATPTTKNMIVEEKIQTPMKVEKKELPILIEKPKEIIKIKEVIKEKVVTKIEDLNNNNFKKYYNSSKYNTLKCYKFKEGDIFPDEQCKRDLKKFLAENKDSLRFEVIPVIAENDNKIFLKLQSNIQNLDKTFQDRVKEYMYKGLSRDRVLETSWYIKDQLGEDTILTPTNYYVKSKKDNKGIIIKAYY